MKPTTQHCETLVLVNAQTPLGEEPDTRELVYPFANRPEILLRSDAAKALIAALSAVGVGDKIIGVSGFRALEEQQNIYADSLRENGQVFTKQFVALPGHSEHQTGLAIDLALNEPPIDFIRPAFPYNGICQRFREIAPHYGFVERYPAGKETITGIAHEPWHFRYVGLPYALIMTEKHLTLEEYLDFLTDERNAYES